MGGALAVTSGDLPNCRDPASPRRFLIRLHANCGRASASQMETLVSQISGIPPEWVIQRRKVARSCHMCDLVAPHSPISLAGHWRASYSGYILGIDLFFVEEIIALIFAQAAACFTYISQLADKEPDSV